MLCAFDCLIAVVFCLYFLPFALCVCCAVLLVVVCALLGFVLVLWEKLIVN